MTGPADETPWPPGWRAVEKREARGLQAQLEREQAVASDLRGVALRVIGRRDDGDDILCAFEDGRDAVLAIHLSYTSAPPIAERNETFDAWVIHEVGPAPARLPPWLRDRLRLLCRAEASLERDADGGVGLSFEGERFAAPEPSLFDAFPLEKTCLGVELFLRACRGRDTPAARAALERLAPIADQIPDTDWEAGTGRAATLRVLPKSLAGAGQAPSAVELWTRTPMILKSVQLLHFLDDTVARSDTGLREDRAAAEAALRADHAFPIAGDVFARDLPMIGLHPDLWVEYWVRPWRDRLAVIALEGRESETAVTAYLDSDGGLEEIAFPDVEAFRREAWRGGYAYVDGPIPLEDGGAD